MYKTTVHPSGKYKKLVSIQSNSDEQLFRKIGCYQLYRGTATKKVKIISLREEGKRAKEEVYDKCEFSRLVKNGRTVRYFPTYQERTVLAKYGLSLEDNFEDLGFENLLFGIFRDAGIQYRKCKIELEKIKAGEKKGNIDDLKYKLLELEAFFTGDFCQSMTNGQGKMILAKLKDSQCCMECPLYDKKACCCEIVCKKEFDEAEINPLVERPEFCEIVKFNAKEARER